MVLDILIKTEQKEYAWDLVKRVNFGKRGEFDGDREQQYTGILGEVIFADIFGFTRPDGSGGFDNGVDFTHKGIKIDLKTMGRTVDVMLNKDFVNNLISSQTEYDTDCYIFASINKASGEFQVVGYYMKKWGFENYRIKKGSERKRHDGTTFKTEVEMFEIPNSCIGIFNEWSHVLGDIEIAMKGREYKKNESCKGGHARITSWIGVKSMGKRTVIWCGVCENILGIDGILSLMSLQDGISAVDIFG